MPGSGYAATSASASTGASAVAGTVDGGSCEDLVIGVGAGGTGDEGAGQASRHARPVRTARRAGRATSPEGLGGESGMRRARGSQTLARTVHVCLLAEVLEIGHIA